MIHTNKFYIILFFIFLQWFFPIKVHKRNFLNVTHILIVVSMNQCLCIRIFCKSRNVFFFLFININLECCYRIENLLNLFILQIRMKLLWSIEYRFNEWFFDKNHQDKLIIKKTCLYDNVSIRVLVKKKQSFYIIKYF